MKKILLLLIIITIGLHAKSVVGEILYAFDEEGVLPIVDLKIQGKQYSFTYSGQLSTDTIRKRKGEMIRAYLNKDKRLAEFSGDIKSIKFIHSKKSSKNKISKKSKGKYLSILKKRCKDPAEAREVYCYIVKRYVLFQRECKKGDNVSCINISDLDNAIKDNDLQGIHYISNTAKTERGD